MNIRTKYNISGQQAVEFALLLGVLFIIAIGTVVLFGDKIAAIFESGRTSGKTKTSAEMMEQKKDISYVRPEVKKECVSGSCTLTLGKLILNNVPDDLSIVVQSTGAAGATDVMANLVDQVESYVESSQPENTTLIEQVADLAEKGKQIALLEKYVQDRLIYCKTNAKDCEPSLSQSVVTLPGTIDSSLKAQFDGMKLRDLLVNLQLTQTSSVPIIGYSGVPGKSWTPDVPLYLTQQKGVEYLLPSFRTQLEEVMASKDIDGTSKQVLKTLSGEITTLAESLQLEVIDAFTTYNRTLDFQQSVIDNAALASKTTDLDSAMICSEAGGTLESAECQ